MDADFNRAIDRLPRWTILLGALGTAVAFARFGLASGGGFLFGAIAAYLNLWLVVRAVDRIAKLAGEPGRKVGGKAGLGVFIQFGALILAAFAIIGFSGFDRMAALFGFLCCPAAAVLEIVYELVTLKH